MPTTSDLPSRVMMLSTCRSPREKKMFYAGAKPDSPPALLSDWPLETAAQQKKGPRYRSFLAVYKVAGSLFFSPPLALFATSIILCPKHNNVFIFLPFS